MSRLEEKSVAFRKQNVARNSYDNNDQYNVGHSNALSNGDEKGKGELENQVGGTTDIKSRETSMTKNRYNKNREYNDATA
jgi:hypothetical protein